MTTDTESSSPRSRGGVGASPCGLAAGASPSAGPADRSPSNAGSAAGGSGKSTKSALRPSG
eukprot:8863143-Pyramimonas_sp.AAC.1